MKHARPDYNRIQDPAGLIPEDEPVFLLRAQDRHAAKTLRWYAEEVAWCNGGPNELARIVRVHAKLMDEWPKKKEPDLPIKPVALDPHVRGEERHVGPRSFPFQRPDWPDPAPEMLDSDPLFDAIWKVIKTWEINVPQVYVGSCGATGNHVRAIYDAVTKVMNEVIL